MSKAGVCCQNYDIFVEIMICLLFIKKKNKKVHKKICMNKYMCVCVFVYLSVCLVLLFIWASCLLQIHTDIRTFFFSRPITELM